MAYRVGRLVFADWQSLVLDGGWSDTFLFPMNAADGLPPGDYARIVRRLAQPLARLRPGASLWVPVDAPAGNWFRQQVQRSLLGLPVPVAVTPGLSVPPLSTDFSFPPGLYRMPHPAPPAVEIPASDLTQPELRCLRVLARLTTAYTAEVAAQAGYSLPTTRKALAALQESRLVSQVNGKYPTWQIRRPGLSAALRSWHLPAGLVFSGRKERQATHGRHRRTARLWPARLRKAWPQAEVWAGWSEVALGRLRPDSLAWGRLFGHEVPFWLEVESGHLSRARLQERMVRRFNQALVYARGFSLRLVFVLLAMPWVRQAAVTVFRNLPSDSAVVLDDWKAFGCLPVPGWGVVRYR